MTGGVWRFTCPPATLLCRVPSVNRVTDQEKRRHPGTSVQPLCALAVITRLSPAPSIDTDEPAPVRPRQLNVTFVFCSPKAIFSPTNSGHVPSCCCSVCQSDVAVPDDRRCWGMPAQNGASLSPSTDRSSVNICQSICISLRGEGGTRVYTLHRVSLCH